MRPKHLLLIAALAMALPFQLSAEGGKRFTTPVTPYGFQNYSYLGLWYNGNTAYTMSGKKALIIDGAIGDLAVNPAGFSAAIINVGNKKSKVEIYSIYTAGDLLTTVKAKYTPVSLCYSPDARELAICDSEGIVHVVSTSGYAELRALNIGFPAEKMKISPNGNLIAASSGSKCCISIYETGAVRKVISLGESPAINDYAFSPDNSYLAVLFSDGALVEYDIVDFLPGKEYGNLGKAAAVSIHADGKYIAVITDNNVIEYINRLSPSDKKQIDEEDGGVSSITFFKPRGGDFLLYSTASSIVYKENAGLEPNYQKLIADEISTRMDEWMRQMPGETLEEYGVRVNEETRSKQMALFEEEIATRLAENKLECTNATLGNYNEAEHMLAVSFDAMPPIYLNVPTDKLGIFDNMENIIFTNARYGINDDDSFELVYVEALSTQTGESFVFDNRERKSLEYIELSDSFVPLDVIRMSQMEETMLESIKEETVLQAQEDHIISNHTNIAVSTDVEHDVDAAGKKILNYKVGFQYDVEAEFSAQEDFGPGKYVIEESGAAKSMAEIIKKAFEGDFAQYLKEGKKIRVSITGSADSMPILSRLSYNGIYGEYENEPVYGDDGLFAVTVKVKDGLTQNSQLAFVRAAGVRDYLQKNIPALNQAKPDYEYHIEVSDSRGGAFRRISVMFTFYDAF